MKPEINKLLMYKVEYFSTNNGLTHKHHRKYIRQVQAN